MGCLKFIIQPQLITVKFQLIALITRYHDNGNVMTDGRIPLLEAETGIALDRDMGYLLSFVHLRLRSQHIFKLLGLNRIAHMPPPPAISCHARLAAEYPSLSTD